jgi:hypothetical protein
VRTGEEAREQLHHAVHLLVRAVEDARAAQQEAREHGSARDQRTVQAARSGGAVDRQRGDALRIEADPRLALFPIDP